MTSLTGSARSWTVGLNISIKPQNSRCLSEYLRRARPCRQTPYAYCYIAAWVRMSRNENTSTRWQRSRSIRQHLSRRCICSHLATCRQSASTMDVNRGMSAHRSFGSVPDNNYRRFYVDDIFILATTVPLTHTARILEVVIGSPFLLSMDRLLSTTAASLVINLLSQDAFRTLYGQRIDFIPLGLLKSVAARHYRCTTAEVAIQNASAAQPRCGLTTQLYTAACLFDRESNSSLPAACLVFQSLSGQPPDYWINDCHIWSHYTSIDRFQNNRFVDGIAFLLSVLICEILYLMTFDKSYKHFNRQLNTCLFRGYGAMWLVDNLRLWIFLLIYLLT